MGRPHKYELYETAVQSPDVHLTFIDQAFKEIRGDVALTLREDFCGTFWNSTTWVESRKDRKAIGIDLDPEPIAYGKKHHYSALKAEEKKRVTIKRQNVLMVTRPSVDFALAGNFSFNIFKEWDTLIRYFKSVYRSLNSRGLVAVEMAGGPGMIEKTTERRRITKDGKPWFTYIWDQHSFDPITREGLYYIHFKLHNGRRLDKLFSYDWRMWTIPEVRLAMKLAGFKKSVVFWDQEEDDGTNHGVYKQQATAHNDHTWICYTVGVK